MEAEEEVEAEVAEVAEIAEAETVTLMRRE